MARASPLRLLLAGSLGIIAAAAASGGDDDNSDTVRDRGVPHFSVVGQSDPTKPGGTFFWRPGEQLCCDVALHD